MMAEATFVSQNLVKDEYVKEHAAVGFKLSAVLIALMSNQAL